MADNYLEKKMEEHRQRAGARTTKLSPVGTKPHTVVLPYTLRGAVLIGDDILSPALEACGKALVSTSCRVAFSCRDRAFGSRLAQSAGMMYIPADKEACMAQAAKSFGAVDIVLRGDCNNMSAVIHGLKSELIKEEVCCDDVFIRGASQAIIYLSLPQSIYLNICGTFLIDADGMLSKVEG